MAVKLPRGAPRRYDLPKAWGTTTRHSFRPNALDWFDRQMEALVDFDVTVTFCFTPEHRGIAPHHTSPPQVKEEFAEFCARMIERYAPAPARPAIGEPLLASLP